MSNFASLDNIITEIQSLVRQLNAGKLQMEELESLNSLTRELNERIVILKYKAYEEKVFGVSAKTEMEQQLVSGKEIQNVISDMSDFLTSDSSDHIKKSEEKVSEIQAVREVQTEVDAKEESEIEKQSEEPAFGFDLFETESSMSFAPEVKPDMETFSETRPVFSPLPEVNEEIIPEVEEELDEDPEPAIFTSAVVEDTIEIEQHVESKNVAFSDEVSNSQKDVFKSFQGLDSGSSLMSPKIQTLVGAFGLNEKLQCIRELYNGSSDAFNQAIEKLDNEANFDAAKIVLSEHAIANTWDLDSNLVNEFLQKVQRRFL